MQLKYAVHRIQVSFTKQLRRGRTGPDGLEFYPSNPPSKTVEWLGGRFPMYRWHDTVTIEGRDGKIVLHPDESGVHYNEDGSIATVKMFLRVTVNANDSETARDTAINFLRKFGFE